MNADGVVVPEQEPKTTVKSLKEASAFARGDLRRYESVQTHIHWAGLLVFWAFVIVVLVLALIWAWHLGAPEKWRFLSTEQQNDLQRVLLAAVGSSALTQVAKKWLSSKENVECSEPD